MMTQSFFLIASVLMLFACVYFSVIHNMRKGKRIPAANRMLISTAFIIFSLGFLHFALLYGEPTGKAMFGSFIRTLQSFSMDLDYEDYLSRVGQLGETIFPEFAAGAVMLWGYAYTVGFLAPIFGGAILLEVITTIFPSLKLWASSALFWKDFCYFSELNDRSLALAKSIFEQDMNFFTRKIIVFTDAYSDEDEENESERLHEAKRIGAIVLKRDIRHLRVRKRYLKNHASNRFFLIDDESREINNLQTLTTMLDEGGYNTYKKSFIYLFMNNGVNEIVEARLFEKLDKAVEEDKEFKNFNFKKYADKMEKAQNLAIVKAAKKNEKVPDKKSREKFIEEKQTEIKKSLLPSVTLIKCYQNIVDNLLMDVPLFSGLLEEKQKLDEENARLVSENKERKKLPLNVTVFGTGIIGTEMFLSAYWCGQMLDCDLHINLVSLESEGSFKNRIDCINSEIFETGQRAGEGESNNSILRIYQNKDEFAPAYFKYRYYCTDIRETDLQSKLNSPIGSDGYSLVDSDYILVALGSDEENLKAATEIKRCISIDHLKNKNKRTVIAYVIYDSDLCSSLRQECYVAKENKPDTKVFMYPFGSLEEVYSHENIFMEKVSLKAEKIGDQYDESRKRVVEKTSKLNQRRKDEYSYWADIARAIHLKYKIFSAGMLRKTVFDEGYTKVSVNDDIVEFSKRFYVDGDDEEKAKAETKIPMQNRMAWLEHRRWCAFMRSKGFKCPKKEVMHEYMKITGEHKNLEMKLHPCLVECDEKGMREDVLCKAKLDDSYDMLDRVSHDVHEKRKKNSDYDFKKYDYPSYGDTGDIT